MINAFAEATGDKQWIHLDPERTETELGMPPIAHGYLTLSLVPVFMQDIFTVESVKRFINYGSNKIRFINMVPVNSDIRGRVVLKKAVLSDNMLRAVFEITVELKGATKPVAIFEAITLMYE
jgi:acyl dehydratase